MSSDAAKREALERLNGLLMELASDVDLVLVEGPRDVDALRSLGYLGAIATCSRVYVNDVELAEIIAAENRNVLILTDFDPEGDALNTRFSELLEHMGAMVERGLRAEVGRIMAVLGVRVVEALDNIKDSLGDRY
jgi:5S rRNA maturation endonuclease (ribonuclease M5)